MDHALGLYDNDISTVNVTDGQNSNISVAILRDNNITGNTRY